MAKGKLVQRYTGKIGSLGADDNLSTFNPPVKKDGGKLIKRYRGTIGSLGAEDSAGGRFNPPVKR
jgi:hypothetical protein